MRILSFLLFLSITLIGCGSGSGGGSNSSEPSVDLNIPPNFDVNLTTSYEMQKTSIRVNRRAGLNNNSPCGCFYSAIVYTDLNGDGDIDIFMSGGDGSSNRTPIEVYINDGSGNFSLDNNSVVSGSEPGAIHPRKAILGDFNGDSDLDIFIAGHGFDQPPFPGEHPLLFLSTGNGLEYNDSLEQFSGFFHAAASADIDNDGDLDIFVGDNQTPFFLINDGFGNFSRNTDRLTSEVNDKSLFTAELIDIDNDGYVDLFVAGHEFEGMKTTIYWGNESGGYLSSNKTIIPSVSGQETIVDIDAEDVNNDFKRDIVVTRTGDGNNNFYSGYYLQLLTNNIDREFTDTTQNISNNSGTNREWIDWVRIQDFNNDGHLDIIEDDAAQGYVWLNDGTGMFTR